MPAHAMQVVKVNVVRPQVSERMLQMLTHQPLCPQVALINRFAAQVELRGNHHLMAESAHGLAYQLLVVPGVELLLAVALCRVEQRTAIFVCPLYGIDGIRLLWHLAVSVRERHAAHADGRHFDAAKSSFLHIVLFSRLLFLAHQFQHLAQRTEEAAPRTGNPDGKHQ